MASQDLLGRWVPVAAAAAAPGPYTEVELRPDGTLRYALKGAGPEDALVLSWRVEGQTIVTRAPGAAREEKTGYELGGDGSLTLEFGGHRARYVKAG